MRYEKSITINKTAEDMIIRNLTVVPTCAENCLDENDTIVYTVVTVYTVVFDNGIEVDVKCCSVQYGEDGKPNVAWCEAVVFENGCKIGCSEIEDDFFDEWLFEYDGNEYVVMVEVDTH